MNVRRRFSRSEVRESLESLTWRHHRYGDLRRFDSVLMPSEGRLPFPDVEHPLYIHLTATMRCNARCQGCISSAVTFRDISSSWIEETVPERDVEGIALLVEREHADPVTVCIYGGEPLLVPDKLARVIALIRQRLPERNTRFMIYTNGQLLKEAIEACPSLSTEVWLYSVSIDGGERQHNVIRRGTDLRRIRENLRVLRKSFRGQVLMWSTLREEQSLGDCFDEFMSLRNDGIVDHFFWHWVEKSEPMDGLEVFACAYEDALRRIMSTYLTRLQAGELLSMGYHPLHQLL